MDSYQFSQYIPVGIMAVVAFGFAFVTLVLSVAVGKLGKRNRAKDTPYECGMLPVGQGTPRLSVKFYRVAMLFILFDVEVVFLYPWAVVYKEMLKNQADLIFGSMISFLAILLAGYIYAVKKRAFDWKE